MGILSGHDKSPKGYHIRNFAPEARKRAKAAAALEDTDIGTWISKAVEEKYNRDIGNVSNRSAEQ
jgi:hypothetical protein